MFQSLTKTDKKYITTQPSLLEICLSMTFSSWCSNFLSQNSALSWHKLSVRHRWLVTAFFVILTGIINFILMYTGEKNKPQRGFEPGSRRYDCCALPLHQAFGLWWCWLINTFILIFRKVALLWRTDAWFIFFFLIRN